MSTQDDEAERVARAKRLRDEIDRLTGTNSDAPACPPESEVPKSNLTPRAFTDKAAAEAARKARDKA